jgi:hypothetical protein
VAESTRIGAGPGVGVMGQRSGFGPHNSLASEILSGGAAQALNF